MTTKRKGNPNPKPPRKKKTFTRTTRGRNTKTAATVDQPNAYSNQAISVGEDHKSQSKVLRHYNDLLQLKEKHMVLIQEQKRAIKSLQS